jgi:hypothetical protein
VRSSILARSPVTIRQNHVFEDARPKPFPDQGDDARVADQVLDKSDGPIMARLSWSCARRVLCGTAFPSAPPLAPPTPQPIAQLCSLTSQLLWRSLTSRVRTSSATAPRLLGADQHALPRLVRLGISRFPRSEPPHMPVSPTTPGRSGTRAYAPVRYREPKNDIIGTNNGSECYLYLVKLALTRARSRTLMFATKLRLN